MQVVAPSGEEPVDVRSWRREDAVADVARLDAYAAREVLHHPATSTAPSADRDAALNAVITAAGLGAGVLPAGHRQSLSHAVALAETELGHLLQDDKAAPDNPPEEVPQPT
ncbi:hypothetical protein [Streptomyces olivochromogenes]|uniref:hypothetical protein n=1 Tax=Streptomyces olivochromogenes TaxID=1963 RepID=UPI000836C299|nr:hypothetical protein [Streptomyces olivochromogenes]